MKIGDKLYCIETMLREGDYSPSVRKGCEYKIVSISPFDDQDNVIWIVNDHGHQHGFYTDGSEWSYVNWFVLEKNIGDTIKRPRGKFTYLITEKMVDNRGNTFMMVNCFESGKKYWVWDEEIRDKWVSLGPYKDPFQIMTEMPKFSFV